MRFLVALALLLSGLPLLKAQPALVQDFSATERDINFSVAFQGQHYFVTETRERGCRLWRSVHGQGQAVLLHTGGQRVTALTTTRDRIIFTHHDAEGKNVVLWQSDGTAEGTQIFKTMPSDIPITSLMAEGNTLFFTLFPNFTRREFWKSDATEEGTVLIKSFSNTSFGGYPYAVSQLGDQLLYLYWEPSEGTLLYKLDERQETLVTQTALGSFQVGLLGIGVTLGNKIIFPAERPESGQELWVTDGTAGGTFLLKDIVPGTNGEGNALGSFPRELTVVGDWVYFVADSIGRKQLWKTDGTVAGTVQIAQVCDGSEPCEIANIRGFGSGERVAFTARAGLTGRELWVTDGTPQGTKMLRDIRQGYGSALLARSDVTALGDWLYFYANDGIHGRELWRTDGTESGTQLVADITPGPAWTGFKFLTATENKLYFFANDFSAAGQTRLDLYELNAASQVLATPAQVMSSPNNWFRQIGPPENGQQSAYVLNEGMMVDSQDHIYITGIYGNSFRRQLIFFDEQTALTPASSGFGNSDSFLAKYKGDGSLLWAKTIGSPGGGPTKITTTKDHPIVIAGSFQQSGMIGNQLINAVGTGLYLAALDENGDTRWVSLAESPDRRTGVNEIHQLTTDSDGNIYMAGAYRNFSLNYGSTTLIGRTSPQFFVAKYNSRGDMLWARNIDIPNWRFIGRIGGLKVAGNRLFLMASENWRGSFTICTITPNSLYVEAMKLDGTRVWSKKFDGNDQVIGSDMDVSPLGELLIVGRFRGLFDVEQFSFQTPQTLDCFQDAAFLIRMSPQGKVLDARSEFPARTDNYQVMYNPDGSYFLTGLETQPERSPYPGFDGFPFPGGTQRVFIRLFDYFGMMLNERVLFKAGRNWFENNPILAKDSKQNLILFDTNISQVDTIYNAVDNNNINVYLMKFPGRDIRMVEPSARFDPADWIVAPNPTSDGIVLVQAPEGTGRYQVSVFSMNGTLHRTLLKEDETAYFSVDLTGLPRGIYLLSFQSGKQRSTKKVMVE